MQCAGLWPVVLNVQNSYLFTKKKATDDFSHPAVVVIVCGHIIRKRQGMGFSVTHHGADTGGPDHGDIILGIPDSYSFGNGDPKIVTEDSDGSSF